MNTLKLKEGKYYHIFNCGINGCEIFREKENYERFLSLYDKYIDAVAETFAWVLMGNHFHLLVRIKEDNEIKTLFEISHCQGLQPPTRQLQTPVVVEDPVGGNDWTTRKPNISNQLSHLFNAYAQYFNKKYKRHGSLFERPFKRKLIDSVEYFRRVVIYIHNNPVHHGFCEHPVEYPWSSYLTCILVKPTKLQRNEVIGWFNDMGNFKHMHDNKNDDKNLEEWLEL
jgi:putative transposase